jgi:hypothetical protein
MSAKKRLGSTAREKPLISVGVSLFSCFLSGFTLNFLCGLPILSSLQVTETLLMIACLWMLMNFIIPDTWDRILANPAVLVLLTAGKELLRNKKIYGSIDKALKIYPDRHGSTIFSQLSSNIIYEPDCSVHIVAALGLVGCTAGGAVTHYITAVQNKSFSGNQKPALATKFSFIFAILHTCATMNIPVFGWLATREELCFLYFLLAAPILVGTSLIND